MKRAIVLAGGGSKGAYEVGFMKAIQECHIDYSIVTGTSIGALNGCLVAQESLDDLYHLWEILDINHVFNGAPSLTFSGDDFMNESNLAFSFFKKYLKNKGADISPLVEIMAQLLNVDRLLNSPIDFGLCTVNYPTFKPLFITKSEMEKDHILDYLIASASCFPVFPIHEIEGKSYIDGGFYDNLPIDLALEMGADEVIVVDMHMEVTHSHYLNRPHIIYTNPYIDLGGFMDFDREQLDRNERIGYQTAMKYFKKLSGKKYTFKKVETPLFEQFYKEVLFLEKDMRSLLRSNENTLTSKLLEYNRYLPLELEDYTFIVLDLLGELLDKDPTYIYNFDDFNKDILLAFEDYMDENYKNSDFSTKESILLTLKDLNKKGIIGRILHQLYYPDNTFFDLSTFGTFFPRELLAAKLIYIISKEAH